MRVITVNVNGIRAAARKGFYAWLSRQRADIVCVQETRAQVHQLEDKTYWPKAYNSYFYDAQKKGYSGVAMYCKKQPDRVMRGMGWPEADREGRCMRADFGDLSVLSLYVPSGSSGDHRQAAKYRFMREFERFMGDLRKERRHVIFCGDWNIAHKNIDIKNWRSNQKNSGFLPKERAWLTKLFDKEGWVDVFREVNDKEDQYTWWSNRGQAREKNVGWRIDYHIATPEIAKTATKDRIYKDKWFSDHAPLIIDYDYDL
ncbi:MAG TPA: exodeoxyribonuclease III [Acidiferrobacteraceae bacterium]|nr:exodeoxyribonuclease III [Acidiferrobacteraceae bacterium]